MSLRCITYPRPLNSAQRDGTNIEKFELCDFRQMYEYFEAQRAAKKALSAAEKKALKQEKDKLEEPFTTCTLDGRKEKVGNFRVEPPGLFRGRGEHPRKGSLKVCAQSTLALAMPPVACG